MIRYFILLLIILIAVLACSYGLKNLGSNEEPGRFPAEAIHALNNEEDLDKLLEEIGNARIVLLGESTHGTSEFYTWRAALSKKLIQNKGFRIIAVEADWSDAYPVNLHIKGGGNLSAQNVLGNFDRWPQWMWKNEEIADLVDWLRTWNSQRPEEEKAGFYGVDVYGIWESLDNLYNSLKDTNLVEALQATAVIDCFEPYNFNEQQYARATLKGGNCEKELKKLLSLVQSLVTSQTENQETLNLLQNTLVAVNAEKYYRTAVRNSSASWNIRDRHMSLTINNLLDHYGPDSRIIVWEHNTHVGDDRATNMADAGMVNVGQLEREKHGEGDVYIVGFGTNSGKVLAASAWGTKVRTMNIPAGRKNSWEWLLHQQGPENKIIFMKPLRKIEYFKKPIGHRAIGVIYNPSAEDGNYVPSVLPERYDAFIFIDKTNPLTPLP